MTTSSTAGKGQVDRNVRPLVQQLRYVGRPWQDDTAALCDEAAEVIEQLDRENEVLYHERKHAREGLDNAVRLLSRIHALLYPAPVKTDDGRTMVFRPKDPDPHAVLQELSDRIRALPDELARIERPNTSLTARRETASS